MVDALLDLQQRIADDLVKLLFEVTIYPVNISIADFERIVGIFLDHCPRSEPKLFLISELPAWSRLSQPALTRSGRAAQANGKPMPFFEPVRKRIREERAFVARVWDGREIDDPAGSWSLSVICEKYVKSGLHYCVRVLLPLRTDPRTLVALARQFAEEIDLFSGHGGPVFAFNPVLPYAAFTRIYAHARRYPGIDIDMLDMCLVLMRDRLKSPCWVNLIGHGFIASHGLAPPPEAAFRNQGIRSSRQRHASLHVLCDEPAPLDVNRGGTGSSAYLAYADYTADFILSASDTGPLDGEGFLNDPGATDAWLHRFCNDSEWFSQFAEI